jgi:type IV pilus assembly protein PilW
MSRIAFLGCDGGANRIARMAQVRASQLGLTLVEMMVAMVLGLLILLAVSSIYLGSRQTFRLQDDNARLQETGRYALEVMGRSIRQAGFWNMPINPVATATAFGGTPITGVNGSGSAPDTVTVQSDWTNGDRACDGSSAGAAGDRIQDSFNLDLTNNPGTGQPYYELKCGGQIASTPAAPGAVPYGQALVDNIEDLQILYGIDTNGDQSADQYVVAPAAGSPTWNQVVSARVCVQARSPNSVNNAPQRFLNCAGALGTATGAAAFTTAGAGDLRLRRTFVATYNLRNRVTNVP